MGKNKMKLWRQWPSCNHPKTLSYRFNADDVYKTVNSVFFDTEPNNSTANAVKNSVIDTPESWFTNSSESASFSTADSDDDESLETVVAGARSERRLFFEPRGKTNSILSSDKSASAAEVSGLAGGDGGALRESVAVAVESEDPYGDFRRSMAEMVETNGVKDWEGLEELLGWYLRVNGKENHAFVVGAFIDLLVELSNNENDNTSGDDSTAAITTAAADSFLTAVSRFSSSSERGRSEIYEEERNLITR